MLEKSPAAWVAILVLAAISGCAEDGSAPDGGGETDGAQELAGEGGCDQPMTLADFCDRPSTDCGSLESITASYCSPMLSHYDTRLQTNTCGGTTLLVRLGLSGMRYDYDASGQPRSVQSYDDVPYGACKKLAYVYGTSCELSGIPAPACEMPPVDDDAGI
jgi:hypothetical protein